MYNKNYDGEMNNFKYDFYFPTENKYIEVTSYGEDNWPPWFHKTWSNYLEKIEKKKKYVEEVLGGDFVFIQRTLSKKEIVFVRKNIKIMV
jgi:hypothetical protein